MSKALGDEGRRCGREKAEWLLALGAWYWYGAQLCACTARCPPLLSGFRSVPRLAVFPVLGLAMMCAACQAEALGLPGV